PTWGGNAERPLAVRSTRTQYLVNIAQITQALADILIEVGELLTRWRTTGRLPGVQQVQGCHGQVWLIGKAVGGVVWILSQIIQGMLVVRRPNDLVIRCAQTTQSPIERWSGSIFRDPNTAIQSTYAGMGRENFGIGQTFFFRRGF